MNVASAVVFFFFQSLYLVVLLQRLQFRINNIRCFCFIRGLASSFLINTRPRVLLNGKFLEYSPINFGVRQSKIVSPTLFFLHINDPVILLCILMILPSNRSVTGALIYGDNQNWRLHLTARHSRHKGGVGICLLILILGNSTLFLLSFE